MRVVLAVLAFCCVVVAFANFAAFIVENGRLRGSAINGYERDGRYFVGARGGYTEVTEAEWRRSLIHERSVLITHLLGMVGMGYLLVTQVAPTMLRRGSARALASVVKSLEDRGAPLTTGRCGGRIGWVNFSGPFLNVTVYHGGVVIKPIFMPPVALTTSEIKSVSVKRVSLSRVLSIEHASPLVQKPLFLYCRENSRLAMRLHSLVGRSDHENKAGVIRV